jgi:RimJ/RimL family protein N-acetyltransferase
MPSLTDNEPIELKTERLLLCRFKLEDSVAFSELAGAFEIADTMISVPHPLPPKLAREWIASAGPVTFAVHELATGMLVGCAELRDIETDHGQAELSFWIGRPFWGRGYASEAAAALIRHGFDSLGLNRIYAHHMFRNPASGCVLQKLGMRQEGLLRQRVRKWGRFEDVWLWAILQSDVAESSVARSCG